MPDEIKALLEEQSQTFEAVKGSIERLDGRCDAIETAFKRTPKTNGGNDPTLEAKQANKFASLIKGKPLIARSETGGMDLNSYREDFALELRARLEARIAPGALRLVQCWTERGRAHLVLAIDMDIEVVQVPLTAHFACGRSILSVAIYHYIACAKVPTDRALAGGRQPWCRVYVPDWVDVPDNLAAAEGLLEHEIRHCEGWAHPLPAQHAGPGRRATESRLYLPHSRSRITTSRPATSAARASLALPRPPPAQKEPRTERGFIEEELE